jgi:hypothetical protein
MDDSEKLRKEAADKLAEADRLDKLQADYPDLKKYTGRWNKVSYFSKTVNSQVTDFDQRHNCGCCNDSPLEIWPYLSTPHGKVYSDPPMFVVGERDPYEYGDTPYEGWDTKLSDANIPQAIIERVRRLFRDSTYDSDNDSDSGVEE